MSFPSQCVLLISISIHVLVVPVLWLKSSSSHETENQSCPHKQIQAALGSFYKVSGKATITLHQYPSWYSQLQENHLTNPTMHLSHIPQYTIQNRNAHISVLNGVLCDMGQVYCGICEIRLLQCNRFSRKYSHNMYPKVHTGGWAMWCLLWYKCFTYVLPCIMLCAVSLNSNSNPLVSTAIYQEGSTPL